MAAILKALAIFLTLATVNGQCTLSELKVQQNKTGAAVQAKPEWGVNIINTCRPLLCIQYNVMLNCSGFQTVEPIDPSLLSVQGDACLVYNGHPITKATSVKFKYAWSNSFPLNPISSEIFCQKGWI